MKFPICSDHFEKALKIGSFTSPLCSRCTAVFFGLFLPLPALASWVAVLALVPLLVDGFGHYFRNKESTLTRRIVSGLLFGYGFQVLIESFL